MSAGNSDRKQQMDKKTSDGRMSKEERGVMRACRTSAWWTRRDTMKEISKINETRWERDHKFFETKGEKATDKEMEGRKKSESFL